MFWVKKTRPGKESGQYVGGQGKAATGGATFLKAKIRKKKKKKRGRSLPAGGVERWGFLGGWGICNLSCKRTLTIGGKKGKPAEKGLKGVPYSGSELRREPCLAVLNQVREKELVDLRHCSGRDQKPWKTGKTLKLNGHGTSRTSVYGEASSEEKQGDHASQKRFEQKPDESNKVTRKLKIKN